MSRSRALVVSAVLALVAAALFGVFVVNLLSRPGTSRLGDEVFELNAAFMARQIERDGPVLFQDLLGGDRDIYIQHLGGDVQQGWVAVKATAPGQPRPCTLAWDRTTSVFRDTRCGSGVTFPADGQGLERYKTSVAKNRLVVDFRP